MYLFLLNTNRNLFIWPELIFLEHKKETSNLLLDGVAKMGRGEIWGLKPLEYLFLEDETDLHCRWYLKTMSVFLLRPTLN